MFLLMLACTSPSPDTGPASTTGTVGPPTEQVTWLRIDPTSTGSATGRLIGWNLGRGTWYSPEAGPTHPEWRTPQRAAAVAALADIRSPWADPYVRFSGLQIDGAAGADGYHFEDYIAVDRAVSADDNMAVYEYMAIVDEMDAEPLVMLNFGSGTAAEAAAYVRYLTSDDASDPLVAARTHWGRSEPYAVTRYELGNEVYAWWNTGYSETYPYGYANPDAKNGGDPAWHGRPSASASDYAARALAYTEAVVAEQPEARLWVPLAMASMEAWGGIDAALADLAPVLEHPSVEAVVVHHYQVDDAAALGHFAMDDPELIVSGSALFAENFSTLRTQLASVKRTEPLQIALSEFHVAGFFADAFFPYEDEAIVGLGLADMYMAYASWGIEHAAQHMALSFDDPDEALFSPWYNPYRAAGDGVLAMPSAQVTRIFAEHLRPQTVPLERIQGPTLTWQDALTTDAVGAVAFAGEDDATIVLLNRDLGEAHSVRLDLPEGWEVALARKWVPDAWDQDCAEDPVYDVAFTGVDTQALELPPGSLLALTVQ